MSCLAPLIRQRIVPGQEQLRKAVRAPLTGVLARNFLPQTWAVITEQETLTIHADESGNITVQPGDPIVRDGAIAGKHDVIADAIRNDKLLPRHALTITYYTKKGEAAFEQLSKYFGL